MEEANIGKNHFNVGNHILNVLFNRKCIGCGDPNSYCTVFAPEGADSTPDAIKDIASVRGVRSSKIRSSESPLGGL